MNKESEENEENEKNEENQENEETEKSEENEKNEERRTKNKERGAKRNEEKQERIKYSPFATKTIFNILLLPHSFLNILKMPFQIALYFISRMFLTVYSIQFRYNLIRNFDTYYHPPHSPDTLRIYNLRTRLYPYLSLFAFVSQNNTQNETNTHASKT